MTTVVDPATFMVELRKLQPSGRTLTMCIAARRRMSNMVEIDVISSVTISRHEGEVQLWLHPGSDRCGPMAKRDVHSHTTRLTDHSQSDLDDAVTSHATWWSEVAEAYDQDADEQRRIDELNHLQLELDRQVKESMRRTKLRFTWETDDREGRKRPRA